MHSRIFGIVERDYYDKNIDKFDWELDYDDSLPGFADYINHDTDINQDFKWLVECLINKADRSLIEVDNNVLTIKFKPGFKEAYFREKWADLIKNLVGSPDSFEQFCGIKPTDFAYRCKKLLDEEYEFYTADEYSDYSTLDEFIRHVKYDTEYVVFDSVDYHY